MPSRSHHSSPPSLPQDHLLSHDRWTSEVVPLLPPSLDHQAVLLRAFQRHRAIDCPSDLLRALLVYVLVVSSFRALGAWAVLTGIASLSDTAWRKRLRKASDWLLWLLSELLASPPVAPDSLPGSARVLLVDATRLRHPGGCGDDWRLHTAYDLRLGRLAQLHLTDRSGGETLARYHLQPHDIVVCDSGYGHRGSVACVVGQNAQLVVRICPTQFPLCDAAGTRLDTLNLLRQRQCTGSVRSVAAWCEHGKHRFGVRLVVVKLPAAVARENRRRLLRRWKEKGRTLNPTTIFLAGFVLVVTTLSQEEWSDEAVARLYRARWQIEVVFKRMKGSIGLGQVRSKTRESVEAQVRAVLVGWAVQEREACEVRQVLREVSEGLGERRWRGAMVSGWVVGKLCLEMVRGQVAGGWTAARMKVCAPLLVRYLCRPMRVRGHQETMVRAWLERKLGRGSVPYRLAA